MSSEFKIDLKFLSTGIDDVINSFTKLKQATDQALGGQTALTKTSDSLGKTIEKQKPSLMQLGTSFGTVTAAGWSLYNTYDALEKTKMASVKADTKVKTATLGVQDAQQKLQAAIAKYGAGSKEAAEATAELAVKEEQLANASEVAAIRSEDVSEAYAQFATTLPTMILSIASAGTAFSKLVTDMGGIHAVGPRIISALQGVGGGIKSVMLAGGGLGLVLTAIATAFVLLATNAFGIRDAFNAFGKAVGDALPFLKPLLDLIGGAANWFLNLINPIQEASAQLDTLGTSATGATTPIGSVETALTTLEEQAVATGDATKLSIENQITLYKQLGTEAETLQLALTAQLQLRTEAEQEHADKYAEFVKAMTDEDEKLRDSLGLTKEEFDKYYEEWKKDIAEFNKVFQEHVNKIVENYEKWEGLGRTAQTDFIGQLGELNTKLQEHYQKRDEGEKMDKEARREWRQDLRTIQGEIETLTGKLSNQAWTAAAAWNEFSTQGVEALKVMAAEMLSGNFHAAVNAVLTAFDETPEKYKENWDPVMGIITNPLLKADEKMQIIVTDWNKLDPYRSFVVAGVEYTRSMAEVGSGLDELVAFELRNTTATDNMAMKWSTFVDNLDPAVKNLPIVKTAIAAVESGVWPASRAFEALSAAGVELSTVMGTDVTLSFDNLKKTIVDLPGPTKAVFATINGEFVKLGEVADTELVSGSTSVTKSMTTAETQSATLSAGIDKALGVQAPTAIKKMVTEGAAEFKKMTTNMKTLTTGVEGESVSIVGAFVKIGTQIGTAWDSTITYLKGAWDGFVKWIQSFKLPELNFLPETEQGKGMQKSPSPGYSKSAFTPAGGMPELKGEVMFGTTQKDTQTLGAAFVTLATVISTAMKTIITQIGVFATTTKTQFTALGTALTTLGTAFTALGTTITTAMTTANTQIGVFSTTTKTQFTAVTVAITALGTIFTTLGTTVTTAMTTLNTQVGVFATTTNTQFTAVGTAITTLQTAFTTLATTVTTAMTTSNTQVGVFTTTTAAQFAKVDTSTKTTGTGFTTLGTTVSTQTTAMTTKINSFSSAMVSAMDKITKAMDAAKKSADALKKSIDALKDKTITITTRYVTSGTKAGQHGYQGIVGGPGNVGGVKVGEGFRPELITVTPLTRGTGNHYGATMGGGFGSPGGRGGGEVVNNITVVLDGRVIQRFVEKTALSGIGVQI